MRKLLASCFVLFALAAAAAEDARPALRVCADPDNLPYSRADGAGFENRIAELVAADFGLPLEYTWLPDRRGFVRKTMGAGLCDLIVGVPAGFERTLNTRSYYRSSYVLLQRKGSDEEPLCGFDDPRLRRWRIGVQLVGDDLATSPPGYALAAMGVTDNVVGFPIVGAQPAAARMVDALARGELDAAFVWGPQAGYFAKASAAPLQLQRIAPPQQVATQRFDFAIAMGVRRGDQALRDRLDAWLVRRHDAIARILADYAVPLVEAQP
ncbi:quinoprotein dehydrogenase-associated putative ABC transporter substrate-binding protein [Ramlibacter sp. XY19]|uniref:quinoprotein dehydrogenase-associated putative ABC transporter substrate-binding protein n=1 Tax=Ramlibacter paludis TaxID=2908000 RepID=UPI0023DAE005|nr:quinoprotein dehydrogenase-associated putative ABC transporter substrate-binding protein [Ramlibacter paludis]MCG2591206.1 quinoprotein dehydrogenase-associated putative ABC transporter substrate-binding protein [Ramlibacter paludis]